MDLKQRRNRYQEENALRDSVWYINFRESMHVIIPVIIAAVLTAYGVYPPLKGGDIHELDCSVDLMAKDLQPKCYHKCENGTFTLPGLEGCIPWLTCADMADIRLGKSIGAGAVKKVL